ncbi:Hypothetical protein NTJ_00474 [Nesidiocoris tenuis]|uniref:Uncharacterized protein n=1 Tax=Nesidiocoris tenuis TaxID=355587 RepID=A0ABN7A680_9HEMI|nr:Hypothetical protein NTJ_00474 [Nesidiocoris tenuis]
MGADRSAGVGGRPNGRADRKPISASSSSLLFPCSVTEAFQYLPASKAHLPDRNDFIAYRFDRLVRPSFPPIPAIPVRSCQGETPVFRNGRNFQD